MTNMPPPPLAGYTIYDPVDPFENVAGPFFWKARDDGGHHFVLQAEARHCNRHGIVHGGLMMTMIDLTMVVCAKEHQEEQLVTVSLNSEFVAAGQVGEIIEAESEVIRRTRSLAFTRGRVFVGDRTLLTASAVLKPLKPR
jgi:acyl-coenzyme A thioesterase 13